MITLTLLHPVQSTPVQSWTFEQESVIRIGRATDNHVVLYSAVVSRHHVELRYSRQSKTWEMVSLGANGTYLNGQQITQVTVINGAVIHLARSGPNLQICFDGEPGAGDLGAGEPMRPTSRPRPLSPKRTDSHFQHLSPGNVLTLEERPLAIAAQKGMTTTLASPKAQGEPRARAEGIRQQIARRATLFDVKIPRDQAAPPAAIRSRTCDHRQARAGMMFCPDCRQPVRALGTVGEYRLLKTLGSDGVTVTQLAWRNGRSLLMQSLDPRWGKDPAAIAAFTQRAQQLTTLHHPHLPRSVEVLYRESQTYWVLEPIWGRSLRQQVTTQGPFSAAAAIALMQQVGNLLSDLHQQSPPLIHQALAPDQMMYQTLNPGVGTLTVNGLFTWIGLARQPQPSAYAYAAPEQRLGQPVGPSTDLFALGLMALYLLTGQPPQAFYPAGDAAAAIAIPDLSQVPPALLEILRKLTQPVPGDRYATAQEVLAALAAVIG